MHKVNVHVNVGHVYRIAWHCESLYNSESEISPNNTIYLCCVPCVEIISLLWFSPALVCYQHMWTVVGSDSDLHLWTIILWTHCMHLAIMLRYC